MWICLTDGFFSIVRDTTTPDGLLVRARNPEHLRRAFPSHDMERTPSADYGWRVRTSRDEVSDLLTDRIATLDYPNFKASVTEDRLHDLYGAFWRLHWRYQQER
jgi:hypothetical protein